MLRAFPMILLAVLAYNAVAFVSGAAGQHDINAVLGQNFSIPMFSGDKWKITAGDMLIALALLLLFVEVIKATRTTHREIVNHALSMLTFMGALVEFIVLKGFGTSTFFGGFSSFGGGAIAPVTGRNCMIRIERLQIRAHLGNPGTPFRPATGDGLRFIH